MNKWQGVLGFALALSGTVAFLSDGTTLLSNLGLPLATRPPAAVGSPADAESGATSARASEALSFTEDQLQDLVYVLDGVPKQFIDGVFDTLQWATFEDQDGLRADIGKAALRKRPKNGESAAVVAIRAQGVGTWKGQYLAPVVVVEDALRSIGGAFYLGDRVQVLDMEFVGDHLIVDALMHGPNDGRCCPSAPRRLLFRMNDGQLQCVSADGCASG